VLIKKYLYFQYNVIHTVKGRTNNEEELGRNFCPTLQCTRARLVGKAMWRLKEENTIRDSKRGVTGGGGTRWRSWLGHCATSRKFAGSIPDGVIGHNPSGRTMVLGFTQPLTEMSNRNIFWGVKAAGA